MRRVPAMYSMVAKQRSGFMNSPNKKPGFSAGLLS
jgi:hypothetical protein